MAYAKVSCPSMMGRFVPSWEVNGHPNSIAILVFAEIPPKDATMPAQRVLASFAAQAVEKEGRVAMDKCVDVMMAMDLMAAKNRTD